ncbi:DUF4179 domain-containing protein [Sporosarcina ureae]|uniref:DUF4179 domain-containing protein n=1 Tax=Sporosarcina ureae TaxID=1571 RepID=UPI0026EB7D5D|nr:DUF4179 domain-containing protein [Sporosarcina ureae]
MKTIYKRFNDLNWDDNIEPLDVSEEEKMDMKNRVTKKIRKSRRVPKVWRNIAAAAVVTIASIATIGIGFPTLANQIPIVNNIFALFNDEQDEFYSKYEEFATGIGQVQTSNGITMTVDYAVYDGKTITMTYSVETEKEIGENIGVNAPVNVKDEIGGTGTTTALKKVSDTQYVGMVTSTPIFNNKPKEVIVNWEPGSIINQDTMNEVKGNWKFNFTLKEVRGDIQTVGQSSAENGVEVWINEIRSTDISTVIEYNQKVDTSVLEEWEWVTTDLEVVDNLGNKYRVNSNGGYSEEEQNFYWSATMQNVDKNAASLIFKPEVVWSKEGKEHQSFTLDPIEVILKK